MTTNEKQLGKLQGKIALITGTELFVDGGIAQV
jgi:hypothetical protein